MYKIKEELSLSKIKNLTNDLELWKYYNKNFIKPKKKFKSELYGDKEPSCSIYPYNDTYLYKDFGTGESYSVYSYIQKKYNISFVQVLQLINKDFKLGLCDYATGCVLEHNYNKPIVIKEKKSIIQVTVRDWKIHDLSYWGKYYITKEILDLYHVFPLSHYWINEYLFTAKKHTYGYFFGDAWKIYQPFEKEYKWITNISREHYCGLKQLTEGEELVLTSSLKDTMVYRVLGLNAINPQSETQNISENLINKIKDKYKNIYVNFDNDKTGREYSSKLINKHPFIKEIFTPEKDISDSICKLGLNQTKEWMQKILK